MKSLFKNFLLCGIAGWCWECFWTGMHSLRLQQPQLMCRTSLWMFPIYGAAAFLTPLFTRLKRFPLLMRSLVYAICIFTGEYISGSLLKRIQACPWNYSHAKLNIDGIIRLDFLPAWMLAGIVFEKIILRTKGTAVREATQAPAKMHVPAAMNAPITTNTHTTMNTHGSTPN